MVEVIYCENLFKNVISIPTGQAQVDRVFEIMETNNLQTVHLDEHICLFAPKEEACAWPMIRTYQYVKPDGMLMTTLLPDPVIITTVDTEGFIRNMSDLEKEDLLKYIIIK